MIAGPLLGRLTDRFGYPREIFLSTCVLKVLAYVIYSINVSAFFPLIGRFLSGLSAGAVAILLGQIAIQTEVEERATTYIFLEGIYCFGATFGPGVGSLVTFDITVFGWHIDQGNSPGIVLTLIWILFLVVTIVLPKDIWVDPVAGTREVPRPQSEDGRSLSKFESEDVPNGQRALTDDDRGEDDQSDDRSATQYDDRRLIMHDHEDEPNSSKDRADRRSSDDSGDERMATKSCRTLADYSFKGEPKIEWNSQILCLFYLIFWNEVLSSTSTFYVPVLALQHFHLRLIHVKLFFLVCTLFTFVSFVLLSVASKQVDERKLFFVCLLLQIAAISLLTSIAFAWESTSFVLNYILLLYICLGMPYFAFPFSNSILSKITDPQNASFFQGSSYATMNSAILISRVAVSFVSSKVSLIIYCFVLVFFWLLGSIWFGVHYKNFKESEKRYKNMRIEK